MEIPITLERKQRLNENEEMLSEIKAKAHRFTLVNRETPMSLSELFYRSENQKPKTLRDILEPSDEFTY